MNAHRIAVIPGDGIGTEVVPEGLRVLHATTRKSGIDLRFEMGGSASTTDLGKPLPAPFAKDWPLFFCSCSKICKEIR